MTELPKASFLFSRPLPLSAPLLYVLSFFLLPPPLSASGASPFRLLVLHESPSLLSALSFFWRQIRPPRTPRCFLFTFSVCTLLFSFNLENREPSSSKLFSSSRSVFVFNPRSLERCSFILVLGMARVSDEDVVRLPFFSLGLVLASS